MSTDLPQPLPKLTRGVLVGVFVLVLTTIALSLYIWTTLHPNTPVTDRAIPSDAKKVVANTLPAGWTVQKETGTETGFFDVACASTDECWVVGGPFFAPGLGFILHTIDGGVTWTETTPFQGYAYSIDFKPPNMLAVSGWLGKVYISNDKGATWTTHTPANEAGPEDTTIYQVSWSSQNDIWATAHYYIYHSTDNGVTWSYYHLMQSNGQPYETVPFGIGCGDDSHCYASGTGGKGFRTSDRGSTWVFSVPENYWNHTLDVAAPSLNKMYLSGGDDGNDSNTYGLGGVIFSSTNSGQTWSPLTIPQSGDIPSIRCINDTSCMAISADNSMILITSDGGITWVTEELGYQNGMLNVEYIDADHAMVVGRGIVLRYSAGSGTSSPTPTPTTIPAGSGTPTSSPTPTPTSTGTPPGTTSTATPTASATPTTNPATSSTPTPSSTSTPPPSLTPSPTPTSTPTNTLTPSATPTATPTSTPIPTDTPVPTATTPPIPTATPIQNAYCDTSCGVCGWRDTSNTCHPDGKINGSGPNCCYHACVNTSCKLISGYGGGDSCARDSECTGDRVAALPETGRYPSATPYPRSTGGAPVSGESSWALILLVPIALILGAMVL